MKRRVASIAVAGAIMLLLSSCEGGGIGPGIEDYEYPVGTGYEVFRSSGHQIVVIQEGGGGTKPMIGAKVVQVAWNDRYVLAKQYGLKRANSTNNYMIPDETVVNYYILDTIDLVLYGGFTWKEFEEKKADLNIPDELVLRNVRGAYRYYGKSEPY